MESKTRLNKYDNLRGIAIFLIVVEHLDILNLINVVPKNFIGMIDLPLLFFVAGYFSKIGPDEGIKSFKRLLVPYLIFCVITKLFEWTIMGKVNFNWIFIKSGAGLWFLIALFFMKMILPIVNRFRYPILISIICALLIGFIRLDKNILGLTYCFAYFPIFLVGFYLKETKNNIKTQYTKIFNLFNKHYKIISIFIIILTVIVCFKFEIRIILFQGVFKGNIVYEMIKRLIVLGLEIGIVLIFDKFMTNRNSFITQFGRNSMAIYLINMYLIQYLNFISPTVAGNKLVWIILTIVFAFIVTYLLSRDVVTKYINKFTDGVYNIIVKPMT